MTGACCVGDLQCYLMTATWRRRARNVIHTINIRVDTSSIHSLQIVAPDAANNMMALISRLAVLMSGALRCTALCVVWS